MLARQTLVGDMAAGLPLVGDAIDWYSLYSGQDLAGKCLSRLSYGITAVFSVIPFLPASWGEQLLKRGGEAITDIGGTVTEFGETFLKNNPTVDVGLSRLLIWASASSEWSTNKNSVRLKILRHSLAKHQMSLQKQLEKRKNILGLQRNV